MEIYVPKIIRHPHEYDNSARITPVITESQFCHPTQYLRVCGAICRLTTNHLRYEMLF